MTYVLVGFLTTNDRIAHKLSLEQEKCHIQNPSVKNYMYCKFNNEGVSILKQLFNFLVALKNENELQLPYFFRISSCFFCLSSRLQTEMEQ